MFDDPPWQGGRWLWRLPPFLFSIYFFYLFGKLLVTQMKVRARILVYDTEMVSPKKAGQIGVGDEEWRSIGEIT